MRFGRDLHGQIVPEWASFHVPYNVIKRALKLAVGKGVDESCDPDLTEVYRLLGKSNESFDEFHRKMGDRLRASQADLCIKYDRAIRACAFSSDGTREFREAGSFLKTATELHSEICKLQQYSRVNEEALCRLYVKVERLNDTPTPEYEEHKSRWKVSQTDRHQDSVTLLNRLDILINSVKEARDVPKQMVISSDKDTPQQKQFMAVKRPALYRAVSNDDPSTLAYLLRNLFRDPKLKIDRKSIVYELAETAVGCGSHLCFRNLISEVFDREEVAFDHNLLNQIIFLEGRSDKNSDGKSHMLVDVAFDYLLPRQKDALFTKDDYLRSRLHYGAMYGLKSICKLVLNFALGNSAGAILSPDYLGLTPLHYAVIKNHVEVATAFLEILRLDNKIDAMVSWGFNDLLVIALRYQHDAMVSLLVQANLGPYSHSSNAETALYIASQIGREDYVKALLDNGSKVHINTAETSHGWTPLFIACVGGHESIVKLLLEAHANQDLYDNLGWTAKEHAAFRGHSKVAEDLQSLDPSNLTGGPASIPLKPQYEEDAFRPLSTHKVIVNLGVLRIGYRDEPVKLELSSSTSSSSMEMSVSIEGDTSEIVKLPMLGDTVNEPFILHVVNSNEARLVFKFYSSDNSEEHQLLGSAAALLESDKKCFGKNRESLIRERTIPIFAKATMDIMGTVTFTCVVANPLELLDTPSAEKQILENDFQIVGHRGLGQNKAKRGRLQLGENTVESFLSAARLGASFVEFDAQLTRDLVPIIYHDFSLSESGTDIPIHDLSFEQFMHASNLQSPRGDPVSVLGETPESSSRGPGERFRSRSVSRDHEGGTQQIQDRMKFSVDFKKKGFKSNTRGHCIQDSFTTLDEILAELPDSIGFNIEIKYPRIPEAVAAGVAPVAFEINTFVDQMLHHIFKVGGQRKIILSSFTPEICMLLSVKQNTYPVMFITNAGVRLVSDIDVRARSLQNAVHFAKRWNLAGIVFATQTLVACPRLVAYVKRSGLACGSYGAMNNTPANAKIQKDAGLQYLMADDVKLVSVALNNKLAVDNETRSSKDI